MRLDAAQLQIWSATEVTDPCECGVGKHQSWTSFVEMQWPASMELLGTLRDIDLYEPTFDELHPGGTRYGDPLAPVAVDYFPYNRSDVYRCRLCSRVALRYTEFGGYYVDHRIRCLNGLTVI